MRLAIILASGKMAQQSINSVCYLIDKMIKQKKLASRRVTIVLPETLNRKVRVVQSEKITKSGESISFSSVICQLIRKGLVA